MLRVLVELKDNQAAMLFAFVVSLLWVFYAQGRRMRTYRDLFAACATLAIGTVVVGLSLYLAAYGKKALTTEATGAALYLATLLWMILAAVPSVFLYWLIAEPKLGRIVAGIAYTGMIIWIAKKAFGGGTTLNMELVETFFTGGRGVYPLRSYGVAMSSAFAVNTLLLYRRAPKEGLSSQVMLNVALWTIVGTLYGGRYLFVLTQIGEYAAEPMRIFAFWEGGLVFYGGAIGSYVLTRNYLVHIRTAKSPFAVIRNLVIVFGITVVYVMIVAKLALMGGKIGDETNLIYVKRFNVALAVGVLAWVAWSWIRVPKDEGTPAMRERLADHP
ncbi:prolipoprotein diacylglyceryl transferase, partial [bacterium]|nr:prolipoprotein diacylglyceryl transferase [bacterium]